jgi:hypothetical protein
VAIAHVLSAIADKAAAHRQRYSRIFAGVSPQSGSVAGLHRSGLREYRMRSVT